MPNVRLTLLLGVLLALAPAWTGVPGAAEAQEAEPASKADDPLAELARKVQAEPDAYTYSALAAEVARPIFPDFDAAAEKAFEAELDRLAARVKAHLKDAAGARAAVLRANEILYGDFGMRTAKESAPGTEPPGDYFPHGVLKSKRGMCLGLSLVYLCVAERAGLPLKPAHGPQHIYLIYDDGKTRFGIETTDRGRIFEEKDYIAKQKLDEATLKRGTYFRPITKGEVLGDLLNAASWCSAIGTAPRPLERERTVLAGRLCVELGADNYSNWDTLAQAWHAAGEHGKALAALRQALDLKPPPVGVYDERYWTERQAAFQKAAEPAKAPAPAPEPVKNEK